MSENETPEENAGPVHTPGGSPNQEGSKTSFVITPPPFQQFSGMPPQTLPNATIALVLGILSIPGCCCYGILGLILGIVAWVLAKGDVKKYELNPGIYSDSSYKNAKAAKVCGIIGTILSALNLLFWIIILAVYGFAIFSDPNALRDILQNMQ